MSLYLVQYFAHDILIDGTAVKGVQSFSISRNLDVNRIIKFGDPTTIKNFYREPNIDISLTKFMSDGVGASFPGPFSLTQTPPQSYSLQMAIVDQQGTVGIKLDDCLLKSAAYSFRNDGFFTEQLTFNGRLIEAGSAGVYAGSTSDQGIVKRRQDYGKLLSTNPPEVNSLLTSGGVLLSVDVSFNVNYGQIPTYGNFYSVKNKFVTYPIDISCSYEILDRKYGQPYVSSGVPTSGTPSYNTISDIVNENPIVIHGVPTIDLGSKNFLVGFDRSGGDAGQGNYSIYKLTYKNNDGSFTIS